MPRLAGNEPWVVAATKGEIVWAQQWGDGDWWWPIIDIELDCGLIGIDVCGKRQVWHLTDCSQLRIGDDVIVDSEDIFGEER